VPDLESGDVIVQVVEMPHKLFKRKGADLFLQKEISLLQALTGVDFTLTHLDGRKIRIENEPGNVVKPDQVMTVVGLGMPFNNKIFMNGNLFITFKIKFPNKIDPAQATGISSALSFQQQEQSSKKKKKQEKPEEAQETVKMVPFTEAHRNQHHGGGDRGNESEEEEEEEGRGGIGCANQ